MSFQIQDKNFLFKLAVLYKLKIKLNYSFEFLKLFSFYKFFLVTLNELSKKEKIYFEHTSLNHFLKSFTFDSLILNFKLIFNYKLLTFKLIKFDTNKKDLFLNEFNSQYFSKWIYYYLDFKLLIEPSIFSNSSFFIENKKIIINDRSYYYHESDYYSDELNSNLNVRIFKSISYDILESLLGNNKYEILDLLFFGLDFLKKENNSNIGHFLSTCKKNRSINKNILLILSDSYLYLPLTENKCIISDIKFRNLNSFIKNDERIRL